MQIGLLFSGDKNPILESPSFEIGKHFHIRIYPNLFFSYSLSRLVFEKNPKTLSILHTWHQEREVLKTSHFDKMQFRSFQKCSSPTRIDNFRFFFTSFLCSKVGAVFRHFKNRSSQASVRLIVCTLITLIFDVFKKGMVLQGCLVMGWSVLGWNNVMSV